MKRRNRNYPPEFNADLKRKIRKRDGHKCQACGFDVYHSPFGHVHHVDGNKQNCTEDNLVLLCATCHGAVHGRNSRMNENILWFKRKLKFKYRRKFKQ